MLTNKENNFAATLTYAEFPRHFVFEKDKRMWKRRQKGFAIGRISHVSPSCGELYYLRILLTKVRGPRTFDDIKTIDGVVHDTFKDACFARGLLDDHKEYICTLKEASWWASGHALRQLFVSMLCSASIQRPKIVWEQISSILSEDMLYIPKGDPRFASVQISNADRENAALCEIDNMLRQNGKTLNDFTNIKFTPDVTSMHFKNHLIAQELSFNKDKLKDLASKLLMSLNSKQKRVFDIVITSLSRPVGSFFFVHGYGGNEKTFLWNALSSEIRSRGEIVLIVASSGIATTLLPSARTTHSRFAIPLQVTESSVCNINQNSLLAELIRETKLIIWDEAPMVQHFCIEAVDRSLKDIMHCDRPFGGKCVLLGGDFRQILPVIPKGSRAIVVDACITSSTLWKYCKVLHLTQNMWLDACTTSEDKEKLKKFADWILAVGDGRIGEETDGTYDIDIMPELVIKGGTDPIAAIVAATYERLEVNLENNNYFNDRAILAPTLDMVDKINRYMCMLLPGAEHEYLSCDTICKSSNDSDCFEDLYTTEFLNTIEFSGLPPHNLIIKVGCPVMLLHNIDQAAGLCNGTRLRVSKLGTTVIEAITLNGSRPNENVLIHRMDMNPSESRWPFKMQRRQFPLTLSFAMTINKSQGQLLRNVGLYLSKPIFTYGQLYVALSRVRSMDGLKIVVNKANTAQHNTCKTKNIVYKEVF